MRNFPRLALSLTLFLTPLLITCLSLFFFFPNDFHATQKKITHFLGSRYPFLLKVPYISNFFEKDPSPVAKPKQEKYEGLKEEKTPAAIEFSNEDVFEAICDTDDYEDDLEAFHECGSCPAYLAVEELQGNLEANYFKKDFFVKNDLDEGIFFMSGCYSNTNQSDYAILLRKGYGGWTRVQSYRIPQISATPLLFHNKNGKGFFVIKKRNVDSFIINESIAVLSFDENDFHDKNLVSSSFYQNVDCRNIFQSSLDSPFKTDEHHFSAVLEVLGGMEGCALEKQRFPLKAMQYYLEFKQQDENFLPDKKTSDIITSLERSQEIAQSL
jgi:hypothetical protein